ncbi:hypothetical protein [Pseudomonas yamanorum]
MRIDHGSGYLQHGGTGRFDAKPDEAPRAAQATSSEPGDAGRQANHQPGATVVRSSGYRPPLRSARPYEVVPHHRTLQNGVAPRVGSPNPNLQLPDSELVKALKTSFSTLKELHEK